MTASLFTRRLELRPGARDALLAELVSPPLVPAALAAALEVDVPSSWPPEFYDADAVRYTLRELGDRQDGGPWGFAYFILRPGAAPGIERPTLIGCGGLRGGPTELGDVEVGYAIVREHRRRGYATEAVRAWIDFAFADPRVSTVSGQTLTSLAGSIGVLEKAGLSFAGAGSDTDIPAGETVIRYRLTRATYEAARRNSREAARSHSA